VRAFSNSNALLRRAALPAASIAVLCAALFAAAAARPDDPATDSVGVIDGEAITVTGPVRMETIHGQAKTVLRSGSDVRVNSGSARIELVEGGQITICGPAHLSVLKAGGSLTVALDSGTIHIHVNREPAFTIYTPQIQVQPVSIGDGPQDVLIGFDSPGSMCIRANRGAVRLEQQLSGQNILVPQTGDVLVLNGQLDNLRASAGHCSCELQIAKVAPAPPAREPENTPPAAAEESRAKSLEAKSGNSPASPAKSGEKEEPIYEVVMPPLVYDINNKTQPEFDPKMIVLIRRVRVRPSLIFHGRVEGESIAVVTPPPAPPAANAAKPAAPASDSLMDRVRNFVRKLWSRGA
jgi:ferric-dicitrate binding protein FerR (iron transport regulator)